MITKLSVNFHLTARCNMSCGYCFNRNHTTVCATHEQQYKIVALLLDYGFSKISFVGGEPTLDPKLYPLLRLCKEFDTTSMLITNGSLLPTKPECLALCDWVGLSIDSLSSLTNKKIGRGAISYDYYASIVDLIHNHGCRLKINTVINKLNKDESMSRLIRYAHPERWKVLQVTKIKGQNSNTFGEFSVSKDQFTRFIKRHTEFTPILVPETSESIIDSYLMVDHSGCFICNSKQEYCKSPSILDVGVEEALQYSAFNFTNYSNRNAIYKWS